MKLVSLLASKNFTIYNKVIAKKFGCPLTAIILSQLCSMSDNLSDNKGWFFCTAETMENETTINSYKQSKSYSKLEEAGIIETKLMGLPAKKYFRILDLSKLFENEDSSNEVTTKQVSQKLENLYLKTAKQDVQNLDTININNQYNNQYKINNKESPKFSEFWDIYPSKIDVYKTENYWKNETVGDRLNIIKSVESYNRYLELTKQQAYAHKPFNYIKDKIYLTDWEAEIKRLQKIESKPTEKPTGFVSKEFVAKK